MATIDPRKAVYEENKFFSNKTFDNIFLWGKQ